MNRAEKRRQARLAHKGQDVHRSRRFPFVVIIIFATISLVAIFNQKQHKEDNVSSAVAEEVSAIETVRTSVYTSSPSWSEKVEDTLRTKCGDIRVFNPSSWAVDTALFEEIMNRECDAKFVQKLELRVFDQRYAVRSQRPGGFYLSNVEVPGAEAGVTISSPYQVLSVIPTGSYDGDKVIFSGEPCDTLDVEGTTADLLTALVGHELIVHGRLRATGVERYPDEECFAQRFAAKLHAELSGRPGFRKK